jgi:hypothetical protein
MYISVCTSGMVIGPVDWFYLVRDSGADVATNCVATGQPRAAVPTCSG